MRTRRVCKSYVMSCYRDDMCTTTDERNLQILSQTGILLTKFKFKVSVDKMRHVTFKYD